jgi:hypothetical protein
MIGNELLESHSHLLWSRNDVMRQIYVRNLSISPTNYHIGFLKDLWESRNVLLGEEMIHWPTMTIFQQPKAIYREAVMIYQGVVLIC